MSLINDALKKAQHQRTGGASDQPPMPGGSPGVRTTSAGQGLPKQLLVLIIGGAAALVVLVVVITVVVVNRPSASPALHPSAAAEKPIVHSSPAAAAPAIVAPMVLPPSVQEEPPVIVAAAPRPRPAPKPVREVAPPPPKPVAAPAIAAAVEPAAPDETPASLANGQDIRILTYIDALRVAGIRASATGSKVLMNDKVYRTNDMVDYTLGLRLTRVAPEGLTFTDANGTTYVKNFQ